MTRIHGTTNEITGGPGSSLFNLTCVSQVSYWSASYGAAAWLDALASCAPPTADRPSASSGSTRQVTPGGRAPQKNRIRKSLPRSPSVHPGICDNACLYLERIML